MMTTFLKRFNAYFRNIYLDYYEVFKEAQQQARRRPVRAGLYGAATVFTLSLFKTNEGLRSYTSEVISACNKIGSVTENCRNSESYEFVKNIGELNCNRLLRQIDLGFSTLIYRVDGNPELGLFRENCNHLRPSIKEFLSERIVDFGISGRWLYLESKMKDYDINEEQYNDFEDIKM